MKNIGYALLGFVILAMFLCDDATSSSRQKSPHSMGIAVACRIGGPAFC